MPGSGTINIRRLAFFYRSVIDLIPFLWTIIGMKARGQHEISASFLTRGRLDRIVFEINKKINKTK